MDIHEQPRLLQIAGIVTWLTISGLLLLFAVRSSTYQGLWWLALGLALTYGGFGAMAVAAERRHRSGRMAFIGLAGSLASAFTLGLVFPFSFLPIYTIVWIAVAAVFVSDRMGYVLLVAIAGVWFAIDTWRWNDDWAIYSVLLYATFHLFALMSARTTERAQAAQRKAERLNRELAATQHLLSEAVRQSERTRIARDLHDLVGHHLTALTIHLQIADRLSDGEAQDRIQQSHALAKLLLADVRAAVGALRESEPVDFREALRLMIDRIPRLNITLDLEADVVIDDVAVAEPLLRCVQEALTNTLRHSDARNTTIRLRRHAGEIELAIVDDGGVRGSSAFGNGLTGMRERLVPLSGSLEIEPSESSFGLTVRVPIPA
ncbi:MAG: sensor histidine kinase [Pseudomonadota bacterium]